MLPRWLRALAEQPGSQIEVLNRAERLGVVEDVAAWLEARQLRNRLVHEYMTDPASFIEYLKLAEFYGRVPAPIVWTRFCNSGRLSHGIGLTDFKG